MISFVLFSSWKIINQWKLFMTIRQTCNWNILCKIQGDLISHTCYFLLHDNWSHDAGVNLIHRINSPWSLGNGNRIPNISCEDLWAKVCILKSSEKKIQVAMNALFKLHPLSHLPSWWHYLFGTSGTPCSNLAWGFRLPNFCLLYFPS